jgi:hypothetical protein
MKKFLILVILVFAIIPTSCQSAPPAEKARPINPGPNLNRIKDSTLLIVVEAIQPEEVILEYGMGTLVQHQGEILLVTHNHYGDLLQDMNILELRDAQNRLIRRIYGYEFKSLIIYQDAGTLVLRAPDGLTDALTPGDLDNTPELKPGDMVQVAHRAGPDRDQVEVIDSVVNEISVYEAAPAYLLRSLNGPVIHPGDSGGGVWYNGRLVSNTWSVITTKQEVDTSGKIDLAGVTLTDLSYTAIFPEVFRESGFWYEMRTRSH